MSRVLTESMGSLALSICHVGSTSVPGLIAKPAIDVDLIVPNVEDEYSYLPRLAQDKRERPGTKQRRYGPRVNSQRDCPLQRSESSRGVRQTRASLNR